MSVTQGSTAANVQQTPTKRRHNSMPKIRLSTTVVYVSAFALVIAIVAVGYHEPKSSSVVANAANISSLSQPDQTSVDNVVATSVAASVAQVTNLPIANNVANLAVSAQLRSDFLQADGVGATKPQIIESSVVNRTIVSYTIKEGDTVDTLSSQFGISKQTIKWANDLTYDTLPVGKILRILPVDGVLYTVKADDTADSIASKYGVDKTRLVLYNDLDVSGLTPNTSIILPSGALPVNEQPGYVAPVVIYAGAGTGFDGGHTWYISTWGNLCPSGTYANFNCTCYAYNRRVQLGLPVGGDGGLPQWGDAGSWAQGARNAMLAVDSSPSVGAIMQSWGHVAIVESILPNGDLSISEMNAFVPGGGRGIVSGRIVPAGNVGQYLYIH